MWGRHKGGPINLSGRSIVVAVIMCMFSVPVSFATEKVTEHAGGSPGLGDPYFPLAGNGGYQAEHYSLNLAVFPKRRFLIAHAVISAQATEPLDEFDLDFRGFHIDELTVDDQPADFDRRGQELIITPATRIDRNAMFEVEVAYRGKPKLVQDPDGSYEGWAPTRDGAVVVCEPQGSPAWYPVNDYPTDKATFDFSVRVPRGTNAVANGTLVSKEHTENRTSFVWEENAPMAPYLATVTTGVFKITQSQTPAGSPIYNAVDPRLVDVSRRVLRKQPRIVDYFQSVFGDYPFETVGAIIDPAPKINYALETQTKPIYPFRPNEPTLAHEIAHQWFGDDVSLASWPDIWLNEGFATWAQWFWREHTGEMTVQQIFRKWYRVPASDHRFWNPPPGNPGKAANLFRLSIYLRGGMTLQALRKEIGTKTFLELLREWIADHHYGNASVEEFIALAEDKAGRDLDHFFKVWLFKRGKPHNW